MHAWTQRLIDRSRYGYNDEDATGIFPSPPKYCEMHDYKETHYIGDTTLTPDEFELWLEFLSRSDYKQEDPLDSRFPKGVPGRGISPAQFFGSKRHDRYKDELEPLTKEADIGHSFTATDNSRMWTSFVDTEGNTVIARVGWWGEEYELLSNNCCFFSDHLLKILCGRPLPQWIFSLAKIGDSLGHGFKLASYAAEQGAHKLFEAGSALSHSVTNMFHHDEKLVPMGEEVGSRGTKAKSGGGGGGCCASRPKKT